MLNSNVVCLGLAELWFCKQTMLRSLICCFKPIGAYPEDKPEFRKIQLFYMKESTKSTHKMLHLGVVMQILIMNQPFDCLWILCVLTLSKGLDYLTAI